MSQYRSAKPITEFSLIPSTTESSLNKYNSISSVASASLTTLVSYTVPVGKSLFIHRIEYSGNNIAEYTLVIDGLDEAKRRTNFGSDLSGCFDFYLGNSSGHKVVAGIVITLKVRHDRSGTGNFEGRIQGVLKDE